MSETNFIRSRYCSGSLGQILLDLYSICCEGPIHLSLIWLILELNLEDPAACYYCVSYLKDQD